MSAFCFPKHLWKPPFSTPSQCLTIMHMVRVMWLHSTNYTSAVVWWYHKDRNCFHNIDCPDHWAHVAIKKNLWIYHFAFTLVHILYIHYVKWPFSQTSRRGGINYRNALSSEWKYVQSVDSNKVWPCCIQVVWDSGIEGGINALSIHAPCRCLHTVHNVCLVPQSSIQRICLSFINISILISDKKKCLGSTQKNIFHM